jgi:hypothetical protein
VKSKFRSDCWLTLALLLVPASGTIAQEPQPKGGPAKLPAILTTEPLKEDPKDDELRKLLKARYNAAVAEMKARFKEFEAGRGRVDSMLGASKRLLESGLELSAGPNDRIKLLEQFLEMAKEAERIKQVLVDEGREAPTELHEARYLRIDAEIRLLRAKR